MIMYQRILVPVDGSPTSERAVQEALRFAQQQSAQLELVHVLGDVRLMDANSYINYAEMKEAITSVGNKILTQAQMAAQQSGQAAEVKLLEGSGQSIATAVMEEARQWQADLIVIGTHGRTGFGRVLFGSVAEGVVRTAHIPVLLIRGT
jgi:nucleotide-binding universal stress UspA family protein